MKFYIEFEVDTTVDTVQKDIAKALRLAEREALNSYRGPNKITSLKDSDKIVGSLRVAR